MKKCHPIHSHLNSFSKPFLRRIAKKLDFEFKQHQQHTRVKKRIARHFFDTAPLEPLSTLYMFLQENELSELEKSQPRKTLECRRCGDCFFRKERYDQHRKEHLKARPCFYRTILTMIFNHKIYPCVLWLKNLTDQKHFSRLIFFTKYQSF